MTAARRLGAALATTEAPGDAVGEQARALVDEVRGLDGRRSDVQVTGPAAEFIDQQATIGAGCRSR